METSEKEAADLLHSLGWKLTPPYDYPSIPNGCYRIECENGNTYFIEGREGLEEKSKISEDFFLKGINIKSINFQKDQFYFL